MSKRNIVTAIEKLSGTFQQDTLSMVICTVDAVNENAFTCDCTPIGGDATTSIPGVNLNAEANDGFLIVPSIGSTIVVATSKRNNFYVFMFSDISKVRILCDKTYFELNQIDGLLFSNATGTNFSVGALFTIKTQSENLKSILSDLIDAINLMTQTVTSGVSVAPPLNATVFTAIKTRLNNLLAT